MKAKIVTNGINGWLTVNGEVIDNVIIESFKPELIPPEIINENEKLYKIINPNRNIKFTGSIISSEGV